MDLPISSSPTHFKTVLLVLELDQKDWDLVAAAGRDQPGHAEVTIDLRDQTVTLHRLGGGSADPTSARFKFEVPESYRHRLLNGLDAIAETLVHESDITRHEQTAPAWLQPHEASL